MIRRLILTLSLLLIAMDATALFHSRENDKHNHDHEEVDHNYRHNDHKQHNHKHHEHKYPDRTNQNRKHRESEQHVHMELGHKQSEHKYTGRKIPQQTHIHKKCENHYHYNHVHNDNHNYKQHEDHKHLSRKSHDHKYREHLHRDHNYKHQSTTRRATRSKSVEEDWITSGNLPGDLPHNQPRYEFKYGVRDPDTGDFKDQWEIRKGDNVRGEYSLVEPDGTVRRVRYTAGRDTGFNAIVEKEGKAKQSLGADFRRYEEAISRWPQSGARHNPPLPPVAADFPDPSNPEAGSGPGNGLRLEVGSTPALPVNHKPVFTGIDPNSNLLAFYRRHPPSRARPHEEQPFDYGIGEYLSRRSYDLSKISDSLNVNSRRPLKPDNVSNLRVARGGFVMGR